MPIILRMATAILFCFIFFIKPVFGNSQNALVQLMYRKDGPSPELFGAAVAGVGDLDGDGRGDFIVGSPRATQNQLLESGSVYVYSGAQGSFINRLDGDSGADHFGSALAGVGDINGDGKPDFVVGAPNANVGGRRDAGAAYVFSGANFSLLYKKEGANDLDYLGVSVAGAGDINADGIPDLIVGSTGSNPGGLVNAGSAFVYSGVDGSLLYRKDGGGSSDYMGVSVAGPGDVNGDGKADFLVSAPYTNLDTLSNTGSIFMYSGLDGALIRQKNGGFADDYFGFSAGGAGDVNGDGTADFIVGAWSADPGGRVEAGSAFVYSGQNGSLLFRKDGLLPGDYFGYSAGGAGDVDGDGRADFIIGSTGTDSGSLSDAGSAFLYSGADGALLGWLDGTAFNESFGAAVSALKDTNGNGKNDFVVGAPYASPGGQPSIGSVYVYSLVATDAPEEKQNHPRQFQLSQNYPNPFNPTTTIHYYLPKPEKVTLEIFNLIGQRVKSLADGEQTAGEHAFIWDGKNDRGKTLPSGIYFYKLTTKDFTESRKMIFLK